MRIISQKKIKNFYGQPEYAEAKVSFLQWYNTIANREYRSFAQIRADFRDTIRENDLYVFSLDEGKYKIATSIYFDTGRVYVRFVGTASGYKTFIGDYNRKENEAE